MTIIEKHFSLLDYGQTYSRIMFYSTGPWWLQATEKSFTIDVYCFEQVEYLDLYGLNLFFL